MKKIGNRKQTLSAPPFALRVASVVQQRPVLHTLHTTHCALAKGDTGCGVVIAAFVFSVACVFVSRKQGGEIEAKMWGD